LKSVALVLELGGRFGDQRASQVIATSVEEQVATPGSRAVLRATAATLAVVAISVGLLLVPSETYELLGDYGYLGVFAVTLLTTGALVLPVPYLFIIAKAGTFLDPLGVALVAGLAAGLGELTGYLLGIGGRELLEQSRWHRAATRWMKRHGFVTVWVFSFVPNPLFDAVGIAAGALRYPVWKFIVACFLGKSAKFLVVAAAGSRFWGGS
jgi:membrane protein YqaA with SNARE-associated domain